MHIFITANSPGELAGWVTPLVARLKARAPECVVTLVITPCQYASGMEAEVAGHNPGIDRVARLGPLLRDLTIGEGVCRPPAGTPARVVFLGGDPLYVVLLAKLLKAPAYAYMTKPRWPKDIAHYFVANTRDQQRFITKGVPAERAEIVGHLMLDSVQVTREREEIRRDLLLPNEGPLVALLPGSRPVEAAFMLPFLLRMVDYLLAEDRSVNCAFVLSPFADYSLINRILEEHGLPSFPANGPANLSGYGGRVRFVRGSSHEVMAAAELAVTIPGTNTLQLAALGTPTLVVVPLNKIEQIPMDGLPGLLNPRIFPFGHLKRHLLLKLNARMRYVALPNMIADKLIMPELRGMLEPRDVTSAIHELLADPVYLLTMACALRELTKERGTADKMAVKILQ